MNLFVEKINNWTDWSVVRQSIPAFTPLVEHIFQKEGLLITEIETIAPGMKLANAHGVSAPKLIVFGTVDDKYSFRYMIMEYIQGKMLDEIEESLSYEDKVIIGQNIRKITDKLNISCEKFTPIDVIQNVKNNIYWLEDGFPESFEKERLEYLANFHIDESKKIYCHGDFHCQNILIDENLNVYLIDFADAMYAPVEYELVYIISSLFCFEKPYMTGYFGDYNVDDIVDLCMAWLPIHAHGHATTQGNFKLVNEITSFAVLRERLRELIKTERERVYE